MYDILKEDGRLIIEVPDSSKFLEIGDCAFVWEEHLTYHTPHTLKSLLERANLDASKQLIYEYLYEDSLIIIAQKKRLMEHEMATKCNNSKHILEEFKTSIEKRTNEIHNYLDKQDSRIAIFGAGHQAIRFIHLNGLHGKIKAVIDDNPIKIGKFIPGTSIPIVSSRQLKEFDICLLALSPESETRVRKKYNEYERNGGIFKSIFRLNRNSLV